MWKKTERAMEVMRERNRRYLEKGGEGKDPDPEKAAPDAGEPIKEPLGEPLKDGAESGETPDEKAAAFHEEEKLKLEKGDVPAMILSAIMVFGPVFLVLLAIVILAWIFLH